MNKGITRSMLLDSFIQGRDIRLAFYGMNGVYHATGVILIMERESGGAGEVCNNFNITLISKSNYRHTTYVCTID